MLQYSLRFSLSCLLKLYLLNCLLLSCSKNHVISKSKRQSQEPVSGTQQTPEAGDDGDTTDSAEDSSPGVDPLTTQTFASDIADIRVPANSFSESYTVAQVSLSAEPSWIDSVAAGSTFVKGGSISTVGEQSGDSIQLKAGATIEVTIQIPTYDRDQFTLEAYAKNTADNSPAIVLSGFTENVAGAEVKVTINVPMSRFQWALVFVNKIQAISNLEGFTATTGTLTGEVTLNFNLPASTAGYQGIRVLRSESNTDLDCGSLTTPAQEITNFSQDTVILSDRVPRPGTEYFYLPCIDVAPGFSTATATQESATANAFHLRNYAVNSGPPESIVYDASTSRVYATAGPGFLKMFDASTPGTPEFLGQYAPFASTEDPGFYPYASKVWAQGNIVIVLDSNQAAHDLHILNASDPAEVQYLSGVTTADPLDLHFLDANRALVVTATAVSVLNFTNSAAPSLTPLLTPGAGTYRQSAYESNILYVLNGNRLIIYNLSDLGNIPAPTYLTGYANLTIMTKTGSYLLMGEGSTAHLYVVDVTDPTAPVQTNDIGTRYSAVSADGNTVTRITLGGDLEIYDATDPENMTFRSTILKGPHNFEVSTFVGNSLYLGQYHAPLLVYNITNLAAPVKTAEFPTMRYGANMDVDGDLLLVGDGSYNYFYLVDISNSKIPLFLNRFDTSPSWAWEYELHQNHVYATDSGGPSILIYDVTNPSTPIARTPISLNDDPADIVAKGNYLYVIENSPADLLRTFDISDPAAPVEQASLSLTTFGSLKKIKTYENYLLVWGTSASPNNFGIYDISAPATPILKFAGAPGGWANDYDIWNNKAYLATQNAGGMKVIDFNDIDNVTIASYPWPDASLNGCYDSIIKNGFIFAVCYTGGRHSLNVFEPNATGFTQIADDYLNAWGTDDVVDMMFVGPYLYISPNDGGLVVVDTGFP